VEGRLLTPGAALHLPRGGAPKEELSALSEGAIAVRETAFKPAARSRTYLIRETASCGT
jgi:hypothetical protein